MYDYLSFRRMITPIIIQVLFWIGVALTILAALGVLVRGITGHYVAFGTVFLGFFGAAVVLVVGVIAVRVTCEILIVFFRINETLTDIQDSLAGPRPPTPPAEDKPQDEPPAPPLPIEAATPPGAEKE